MLGEALGEQILCWLESLPAFFRAGSYFFSHAGIRPGVSLAEQHRKDLLWSRAAYTSENVAKNVTLVHGHREVPETSLDEFAVNIDTAAYKTGTLTALGLEGRRRWIVTARI